MARRVVRTKGHVTGVEFECRSGSGKQGVVKVTPGTGRVIVSAGTMGSAKLLFRSELLETTSSTPANNHRRNWSNRPIECGEELFD